jgi:hypothetical protein
MTPSLPDLGRLAAELSDPLRFARIFWPHAGFYSKEREMIMSVKECKETVVVAANGMGKDYTSGFIALSFFIAPQLYFPLEYVRDIERQRRPNWDPHTRRIITTSIKDDHIDVLWGEIGKFYRTCEANLDELLLMVTHEIRFRAEAESKNPLNYLKGQVSKLGEGMAGHHAAYTLIIGDEASGLVNAVHEQGQGWAKKELWFGNAWPTQNFWREMIREGNVFAKAG